jgi:hypothetical protein
VGIPRQAWNDGNAGEPAGKTQANGGRTKNVIPAKAGISSCFAVDLQGFWQKIILGSGGIGLEVARMGDMGMA